MLADKQTKPLFLRRESKLNNISSPGYALIELHHKSKKDPNILVNVIEIVLSFSQH